MRKAFDTEATGVLEIKPIDEIVEDIVPEGLPEAESKSFKHEEVFIDEDMSEEVDHDVESITQDPIKKGIGKRGKDKKPRVKKPPTEKQLAHLKKIRLLSAQRREATKLEKQRIKLEIKKKALENTKKNAVVKSPIINKTSLQETTKIEEVNIKENPNQNNINPTNISQAPNMEQFITLMERYEEYKEKKAVVKKTTPKPQTLPTGRTIAKKYKPEPLMGNPLVNAPTNPFDVCFNYRGY